MRADDPDGPLQLQLCSLDYSSYVGRIGIGRINRGRIRSGQQVAVLHGPDSAPVIAKVNQVLVFKGLERVRHRGGAGGRYRRSSTASRRSASA